jgi:hypothetical protein
MSTAKRKRITRETECARGVRITRATDFLREPFTFSVTFECDPSVAPSAHYLLATALTRAAKRLGIPTLISDIHEAIKQPEPK